MNHKKNVFTFRYFLVLPAPLLQSVVYSIDKPYFAKFGAIGSIIGHELTHAFFAKEVQEKWENNTKNIYKEKSKCVTQEFMNYSNHQNFFAVSKKLSDKQKLPSDSHNFYYFLFFLP